MSDDKPKSLAEVITHLEIAAANAGVVVAMLDHSDISKTLLAFGMLHDAKKAIDNVHTYIGGLHRKLSEEVIPGALENAQIESLVIGGKRFGVSTRVNASIPAAKRDAGHAWLRDVAKCGDLINETVNAKQLSSFIEAYFEEHAELPPEEAVTVHMQQYTTVRKAT